MPTPYELDSLSLFNQAVLHCAKNPDSIEAVYYGGAVLARMNGETPPFKPEQKVRAKGSSTVRAVFLGPIAKAQTDYTVGWMFYEPTRDGGFRWTLGFKELPEEFARFDAQHFEAVS